MRQQIISYLSRLFQFVNRRMNSRVRDLYKRFLLAGKDYYLGLNEVREKVKQAFFENKDLVDELSIKRAIARGRYTARELQNFNRFHKYRNMRKKYGEGRVE